MWLPFGVPAAGMGMEKERSSFLGAMRRVSLGATGKDKDKERDGEDQVALLYRVDGNHG